MAARVLFVDDDPRMIDFVRTVCSNQEYTFETFLDHLSELAAIQSDSPFAVVLSDVQMPEMNGVQLLSRVREIAPDTVRMLLTGAPDLQVAIDAVNEGQVFRFLTKPCAPSVLHQTLAAGIAQYRLVTGERELLERTLAGSIRAMSEILAIANPVAFGRTTRIRQLAEELGNMLKVENRWQLEVAALLCQIGCIAVPDNLLAKAFRGAELGTEEQKRFEEHVDTGYALIARIPRLENVSAAIAYQQKRFDGGGYPRDDARGDEIPYLSRILKVAIDFDTLVSGGLTRPKAVQELEQRAGFYDPRILNALSEIIERERPPQELEITPEALLRKVNSMLDAADAAGDREVKIRELIGRMVLVSDIHTIDGQLLLGKGHEITVPMLHRLQAFADRELVREPVRIHVLTQS